MEDDKTVDTQEVTRPDAPVEVSLVPGTACGTDEWTDYDNEFILMS